MKTYALIPSRFGSSRFPGKPLAVLAGKPLVVWVVEAVSRAKTPDAVVVATDDERIAEAVRKRGGTAVMTPSDLPSGTDRIACAARAFLGGDFGDDDILVNVQGDEPLMSAKVLSQLIATMRESGAEMGTAAVPFSKTGRDPNDPNAVKVVIDRRGFALYFSRSLIPFPRSGGVPVEPLLHWGLYAYRRDFLYEFVKWERGKLEACESLEQLRALENGAKISVIVTPERSVGVDVPEDIAFVEKMIAENNI